MDKKYLRNVCVGVAIVTIGALVNAYADIQVLKEKEATTRAMLIEIRADVKYIREHLND